jgi:tetratricopeptide (TPR) repeat protein
MRVQPEERCKVPQIGSCEDTVARLSGWVRRSPHGLAAVEFDSDFARLRLIEQLRGALAETSFSSFEIEPSGQDSERLVSQLLDMLSRSPSGVANVTAFRSSGAETAGMTEFLRLINLQRDVLAHFPLWQIWWFPTAIAEVIGRAVPDLASWFLIRLHLSDPALSTNFDSLLESRGMPPESVLGVQEARRLANNLRKRAEAAAIQGQPQSQVWRELARPAIDTLRRADLGREAEELEASLRQKIGSADPKVFISYSHDSVEHSERVVRLASRLRKDGVPVVFDRWEMFPGAGWSSWVEREIHDADFILAICSPTYRRRVMGELGAEPTGAVGWEGAAVYKYLAEPSSNRKFIPILLDDSDLSDIPSPLRAHAYIRLQDDESYQRLVRALSPVVDRAGPGAPAVLLAPDLQLLSRSNVPQPGSDVPFVGRDDSLQLLEQYLLRDGVKIVSITGEPGIGKTRLCIEFLRRCAHEDLTALWSRADSSLTMSNGIAEIARLLNLPARETQQDRQAREAVKNWLEQNRGWVLVLDDAARPADLVQILPDSGNGLIIITSRLTLDIRPNANASIQLGPLSREETLQILSSGFNGSTLDREKRAIGELAEALGGLPLAAHLARSSLSRTTVTEYLNQFRKHMADPSLFSDTLKSSVPRRAVATWALGALQIGHRSLAALELLRLAAFLAPNELVPLDLFSGATGELIGAARETLRNSLRDDVLREQLVQQLVEHEFVRLGSKADRFIVDSLIQSITRDSMNPDDVALWQDLTVNLLNRAFPTPRFENWSDCELLAPHAVACVPLIDSSNLNSPQSAELLKKTGFYLFERARYAEAEGAWKQAHRINLAIGNQIELAACLNNLGLLYDIQGRTGESEAHFREAIRIRQEIQGEQHPEVAACLSNLANLYQEHGRFLEAEDLQRRSLQIREATFGPDHIETASTLNNLSLLYDMQGMFVKAQGLIMRVLEIRERVLGSEHPAFASALQNLGNILAHLGRLDDATRAYERALPILERALGPEHPDVATSWNNLGSVYLSSGQFDKASDLLRRALEIRRRTLGSQNPLVAGSLNNLGIAYSRLGRIEEAQVLFKEALAIYELSLGPEHERTIQARYNEHALTPLRPGA